MNALREYAVEAWGADATISNGDALLLLREKYADGSISLKKAKTLLKEASADDPVMAAAVKALGTLADAVDDGDGGHHHGTTLTADEIDAEVQRRTNELMTKHSTFSKYAPGGRMNDDSDPVTPDQIFGVAARAARERGQRTAGGQPNVKAPSARYSTKRWDAKHPKLGALNRPDGKGATMPSERDLAMSGAYIRGLWCEQAKRAGVPHRPLDEHERDLLAEAVNTEKWCGKIGDEFVSDMSVKGSILANDTLSGGNYLNPIFFDSAIVDQLLLSGELFPLVDLKDIPHGTTINTASVGNPTATWNTSPGSSIPLFVTDSLIQQINGTIFDVDMLLEVSLNLLADSPVSVGTEMSAALVRRMTHEFDRVIAVGDGVTQPQGVVNAAGINTYLSVNASAGPWTAKDTEMMIESVPKQYRASRTKGNIVFCSTDGLYWRIRGIQVSGTDQRRIYGYDYEAYQLASRPWKISNDLGPAQIFFGDLDYYRMWRRMGLQLQFSTEGLSLMQNKAALLLGRARIGGKVVQPAAFSLCQDAQHS